MSIWQSAVLAETRKSQVRVGDDVPSAGGETGCSLWVVQQPEFDGCCPGVQALTVMFCFNPIDMLAVEVANIQAGVCYRREDRWCKLRAWRFVEVNDLISCDVSTQPLSL